MSTPHPQTAEVERLLAHLAANKFTFDSVSDGEEIHKNPDPKAIAEVILSVDESFLYMRCPESGKTMVIFIVLGKTSRRRFAGRYDVECIECNGTGKILVPDWGNDLDDQDRPKCERLGAAYDQYYADRKAVRDMRAEQEAERRMGA